MDILPAGAGFAEKLQSNARYNLQAFVLFLLPIHIILKFGRYQGINYISAIHKA